MNNNDLKSKYPELTREWHSTKNNDLKLNKISSSSPKKVWWKCSVCYFEWCTSITTRTRGNGCPKCSKSLIYS